MITSPPLLPDSAVTGKPVKPTASYVAILPAVDRNGHRVKGVRFACYYPLHGPRKCVVIR